YTKNHYHVLGLPLPVGKPAQQNTAASQADVKTAYRRALLAAHPDKASNQTGAAAAKPRLDSRTATATATAPYAYTIDDVKEAYTVLGDASSKRAFDAFLKRHFDEGVLRYGDGEVGVSEAFGGSGGGGKAAADGKTGTDFVLGLELLDLSDFVEGEEGGADGGLEWTRACRCGDEGGFRIREGELEEAEGVGEKEVLVGCRGCSLWVRVGFEVE
ncbi:hypothetical protein BS50DRAFT_451313, partial [Corynespora cassiicola Philippines]